MFYQMVCIHKHTAFFFFLSAWNTQLGFFSSFDSLERRWCVREREKETERKGGKE